MVLTPLEEQELARRLLFFSFVECVCADGSRTAPLIIFKKKEDDDVSPAWVTDNEDRTRKNWVFTCSGSGYINGDLMLRWLHELFLPHIAYEKGHIILLDRHSSNISFRLVMEFIKYNSRLFILPAHTSQLTQVLDVSCFGPFKKRLKNIYDEILVDKPNNHRAQKGEFIEIYKKARFDPITARNTRSGYKATGIYPFEPEKILSKLGEVWVAEHEEEKTKKSERNFILYEDLEGELKYGTFVNEAHETMLERLKIYVSEDEFRIWKNWLGVQTGFIIKYIHQYS